MKNKTRLPLFLAIISAVVLSACDLQWSPFGPSNLQTHSCTGLDCWRPCVIVHTPGSQGSRELETQFKKILELKNAGKLSWLRLGTTNAKELWGQAYLTRAKSEGFNVFAIISQDELYSYPSWE